MTASPGLGPAAVRRRSVAVVALAAAGYGALLFATRPASPADGDEILFLKALRELDVASHQPHPPGYPVYVMLGRLAALVVPDPVAALQLVSAVAAAAALLALWLAATRLGAPPVAALVSTGLLAATPAFAFMANVGMSDVPGTAAALSAFGALAWASTRKGRLPVAAALVALSLGVRPQLFPVLLLPLALAVAGAWTSGRRRELAYAAGAGAVVSVIAWLPVVAATGPSRYWAALELGKGLGVAAPAGARLEGAAYAMLADSWLVRPFGSGPLAGALWALAAAGAWQWWRSGHRAFAALAAACAATYLAAAVTVMDVTASVRFAIPAVPFLALLASGVAAGKGRVLRAAGVASAVAWMALAVAWGAPAYRVRRQPAPAWECLCWIRDRFDPAHTTVVYELPIINHAKYVLGTRGFELVALRKRLPAASGRQVFVVTQEPTPLAPVVFARSWPLDRLRRLSPAEFLTCFVGRAPSG